MLCALLACVALFSTGAPAEVTALPAHPQVVLLQADASAHGAQDPDPATPTGTPESITADLAGDLPELLVTAPQPLAPSTRFNRLVRQSLHALPHPVPERPQRPPRLITLLA